MPSKRALLVASPFRGLRGPPNDVEKVAKILGHLDFDITRCCGTSATRDGILSAWRRLIEKTSPGDAVVIYYSGHGGIVESPGKPGQGLQDLDLATPWRYQFLVPMDFDKSTSGDFRGVLDVE